MTQSKDWIGLARNRLVSEWYLGRWQAAFPLRLDDPDTGTLILVLNSVLQTNLLGESALGELGAAQLLRLSTTLSDLPTYTRYVLIVTHHAPFRAPGDWTFLLPWRGGGLLKTLERIKDFAFLSHAAHEARDLLAVVSGAADLRQDVQFVMFCGHRHQPNVGRAGRVLVVEGGALAETDPSTCLVFADGPSLYIQRAKVGAAAVRV